MIISKYKSEERQFKLWDEPLGNHGHVRTVIGELAEELTSNLVKGRRHKTQSNADYCPDVSADGEYFESKVVGRSKTAFVYSGRVEKDRRFVAEGNRLFYVVWSHSADTKQAKFIEELRQIVLANMQAVYVVPFIAIDELCRSSSEEKLNSKYGRSHDGTLYGSGFRLHLSLLEKWIKDQWLFGLSFAPGLFTVGERSIHCEG